MVKPRDARKSPFLLKKDKNGSIKQIRVNTPFGGQMLGSIVRTNENLPFIIAGQNTAINSSSNGQIRIDAIRGSGIGDPDATYIVLSTTSSLTNERALANAGGINIVDGGAGNNLNLSVAEPFDNNATYVVISATGSLNGERVLAGGNGISIVDGGAGGNVSVSNAKPFDDNASYVVLSLTSSLENERRLVGGSGISITDGGANGDVSVSNAKPFDDEVSYVVLSTTSSLENERVLANAGGINITDGGAGNNIDLSVAKPFDDEVSYLTLATTSSLNNERNFVAGTGLRSTDSGAGSSFTLNTDDSVVATLSGSRFSGNITVLGTGSFESGLTIGTGSGDLTVNLHEGGTSNRTTELKIFGGDGSNEDFINLTMQGLNPRLEIPNVSTRALIIKNQAAGNLITLDGQNLITSIHRRARFRDASGRDHLNVDGVTNSITVGNTTDNTSLDKDGTGKVRISGSVYFPNDVHISGTLSKAAGTFLIPHTVPDKNSTHLIRHSFVESNDRGTNIYRYKRFVNKSLEEKINLPCYFDTLNENVMCVVSPDKHFGRGYAYTEENTLHVRTDSSGDYFIVVYGTRKDKQAKRYWDETGEDEPEL